MPSTENTTLDWIQQEIQDVMERERELKKYYNKNNSSNNSTDGDASEEQPNQNGKDNNNANGHEGHILNGNGSVHHHPPLLRAKSTSAVLDHAEEQSNNAHTKPSFRRFVSSHPSTKGVMHRFLKSRGKLQVVAALSAQTNGNNGQMNAPIIGATTTPFTNFNNNVVESYEMAPPKFEPGQRVRKGFVSAEVKIQRDIADTFKREAELKTLRQSQGNLASLDDDELDAPLPNYMGGLRASKSMAQLYNSNEHIDEPVATSAPSSLKQARSLAELCDAKEEEVTSSQSLIMRFEQMIIKNQESKRT